MVRTVRQGGQAPTLIVGPVDSNQLGQRLLFEVPSPPPGGGLVLALALVILTLAIANP